MNNFETAEAKQTRINNEEGIIYRFEVYNFHYVGQTKLTRHCYPGNRDQGVQSAHRRVEHRSRSAGMLGNRAQGETRRRNRRRRPGDGAFQRCRSDR